MDNDNLEILTIACILYFGLAYLLFLFVQKNERLKNERKELENDLKWYNEFILRYVFQEHMCDPSIIFYGLTVNCLYDKEAPKRFLEIVCVSQCNYRLMHNTILLEIDKSKGDSVKLQALCGLRSRLEEINQKINGNQNNETRHEKPGSIVEM